MKMSPDEIRATYDDLSRRTVWDVLRDVATRLPQKVAVVCGDERLTFSEVFCRSRSLAAGLARLGLQKGDMAAIYMPNSVEILVAFYALQKLGVVVAWLNTNYRESEARFILENSGAKVVFLFHEWQGFDYLQAVRKLGPLPQLKTIIAVRTRPQAEDCGPDAVWFDDLLQGEDSDSGGRAAPSDLSMPLYTSSFLGASEVGPGLS